MEYLITQLLANLAVTVFIGLSLLVLSTGIVTAIEGLIEYWKDTP